jgi:adenosylcobinamide kinase/adenosylcobinamide-phosphate guanylyltransferase
MIVLVTGGSGSGKSAIAENISFKLKTQPFYYIATMKIWDDECQKRIEKHRSQRDGKGFKTVEIPDNLFQYSENLSSGGTALLECMSNLLSNEQFGNSGENAVENIKSGIEKLIQKMNSVVIVTNEIFTDKIPADTDMRKYIENLGNINCFIAQKADIVIEVSDGIPIIWKGREIYNEIFN